MSPRDKTGLLRDKYNPRVAVRRQTETAVCPITSPNLHPSEWGPRMITAPLRREFVLLRAPTSRTSGRLGKWGKKIEKGPGQRQGPAERCWIWKSITLHELSVMQPPNRPPLEVLSKTLRSFYLLSGSSATSTLKLSPYCYLCRDKSSSSSSASQAWPCGLHAPRI